MTERGEIVSELPVFNPDEETQGEVIPHPPAANDRSLARRIALQILYEVDSAGHSARMVTAIHLQARQLDRQIAKNVHRLVSGVTRDRERLDALIHEFAPEFPVAQMAIVDRNILRIGFFELSIRRRPPVSVIIDEAVSLASLFGAENTPGFVNGVLATFAENKDALAELEPDTDDEDDDEWDGDEEQ